LPRRQWVLKLSAIILLLPFSYEICRSIMDHTPVEKEYADMLPVIKTMANRFLKGYWQHVYDPIPEIWGGIQPIYLPAMWLPFTSSLLLNFDPRWITVSGIWLSVALCVGAGIWQKKIRFILFAGAILLLLSWLHFDDVNNVIRLSEEGIVFFYYSLLVIAIISEKPWLIGIAAALCLMSRYALIGWIPFAVIYSISTKQYRFLRQSLVSGLTALLLLIIPFGLRPLQVHWQLPQDYIGQAQRVWLENPGFFNESLGMAKFFGPNHVQLLHVILVAGVFLVPMAFFLFIRKKSLPRVIVLLSGLQLCLTFFYNFLDVSYLYLYYTPVFVSLCITGWVIAGNGNIQAKNSMI
jgi:hypothetical protein